MASTSGAADPPSRPGTATTPVARRGLLTVGVMAAMVMQILDTTIANVALPHMQASLGATTDTVTWVLTSYIIASAAALPVTGWLSNRFGSRNLFLWAVGGFIVASMLCGTAVSLEEMVIFRMLQGVAGAFIAPLSQTVLLDINPPERHAKAMSVWGMGVMVGPIMGPVLGGWLTENYDWRWVFYVNLPIGVLTLALLWFLLPTRPRARRPFDIMGFAILTVAISSFQLLLDRGAHEDWFESWEIRIYAGVAAATAWMFLVQMRTAAKPLFDRTLFGNRNLLVSILLAFVIGVSTMAPMALLPPMLQQLFGYPVIETGYLLAPRGIGVFVSVWLVGQLAGRVDPRYLMIAGMAIAAWSTWEMAHWSLDMDWHSIALNGLTQGFGLGLVFVPLNMMAFSTLPAESRTDGAGLLSLSRSLGSSVGISLVTIYLTRNGQIAHADLAGHITSSALEGLNPGILAPAGSAADMAAALVDAEVTRQAMMIAYVDDFFLMTFVILASAPLILLLRKPQGRLEMVHSE